MFVYFCCKDFTMSKSVALLISGGVDSAVACRELVFNGYKPHLFYIAIGPEQDFVGNDCKMEEDVDLCKLISKKYDLPFEVIPLHNEYWNGVMSYHVESLKAGRTPNPDLLCNQLIKFGSFEEKVGHKFDFTASGHYASIMEEDGKRWLATAKDKNKDQTYFLAQLSDLQISKIMFPIGGYTKAEIREIARNEGFANAERKDSQGICFIARNHYRDFVGDMLGEMPGDFVDIQSGERLGRHKGHWFFTIGQRKGLGLAGGPWFVVKKDIENNIIYISKGYEPEEVFSHEVLVSGLNFPTKHDLLQDGLKVSFKIRHTPIFSHGIIHKVNNDILIESENKLHGVAPGQFAVIYDDDERKVLASGEIQLNLD